MNPAQYKGYNPHPFRSSSLWANCDFTDLQAGRDGWAIFDDFLAHCASSASAVYGPFARLNDTGTVASIAGLHQVQLATGATTNKSAALYLGPNIADSGIFTVEYRGQPRFWAETRVKTKSAALANQATYFGLVSTVAATSGATIIADTTPELLTTESFIGWWSTAGSAPTWGPVTQNLSTLVEHDSDYATIALDTWVKLGFYIDGQCIRWYYNGTLAFELDITSTSLPAAVDQGIPMNLMLYTKNNTGTTKLTNADWIMAAATQAKAA